MSSQTEYKRYKKLDNELHIINRDYITPKMPDVQKYMFNLFFNAFKSKLYETEPLLADYKSHRFVGSSYEGLSVGKSYKEFDINIHIKLDDKVIKPSGIQKAAPGFVTLNMEIENSDLKKYKFEKVYKKWMDDENYINPDKFYSWGQGVMDNVLSTTHRTIEWNNFIFTIKMSKSGPAFTLRVEESSGITFDVDIVFCLSFDSWHFGDYWNGNLWVAVAKQPKQTIHANYNRSWRYSFYDLENYILHRNNHSTENGYNHLKNTIRLIKQVRDSWEMSYLASYYIKTLFVLEVQEREPDFWDKSLGYLFVIMLRKLRDALMNKTIKSYFDDEHNLLSACEDNQLSDGVRKLDSILSSIDKLCDNEPHKIMDLIIRNPSSIDDNSSYCELPTLVEPTQQTNDSLRGLLGIGLAVAIVAGITAFTRFTNSRDN